jgi:uncharacterized membrane protein YfcA
MFSALPTDVTTTSGSLVGAVLGEEGQLLLGDDFLPWIILAFGAAMVAGNVLALVRPPTPKPGDEEQTGEEPTGPPFARAAIMIVVGLVAAVWGIASLLN